MGYRHKSQYTTKQQSQNVTSVLREKKWICQLSYANYYLYPVLVKII